MTITRKRDRNATGINPRSPNVSQKSASSSTRGKPQDITQEQRISSMGNSYDGGDKDPSKNGIERPHTVHVSVKRKREII
jgi:hypothetical protein